MKALSNLDFLQLWERGSALHPIDRALVTLAAAFPQQPYDALADWPLGRRNTALAAVHRACFGGSLEGWVACPQCGERLEFAMDTAALQKENGQSGDPPIDIHGRSFRLPTSRDLASIAGESDPHAAALQLMHRCCVDDVNRTWTEQDLDEIGDHLAKADAMAETVVNLRCALCSQEWNEPLDIAAWLWTEIEAQARRLLISVHTLASAYGWSEGEILSLSEQRRAIYLEMVQA